jgi:uncharacterized Zn-binding protein involved in type VI secretion
MKGVIREGDKTDHGCQVVTASENSGVMGKGVARVGDRCTCGQKDRHECVIVEGSPKVTIDGREVAFDGHRTSCGATLISTLTSSGLA